MEPVLTKEAAVAAIIARTPSPEVLFLKRRANPRDPWSGHYAFPGGRHDEDDPSLLATCLRETYEECGIYLSTDSLVKTYPARPAGNYLNRPVPVTTFLFEISIQPVITLQKAEISCHEWLDLEYLRDTDNIIRRPMSPRCPEVLFPCIPATEGFIWGFTYETLMMIIADHYSDLVVENLTAEE
ncbi:NUDIX hydrolase [Desulfobulbus oligotrophicus]|jgi:8-oxo-dGTP pyrophosphatase MutT (NUDIX family)|uniref:CoA pyrophosphatase n=1 Tax=Desulfobulbus oligotrophicus TaxID=1909699 RepID=A0A7T5VD25_9BACT|nr:CoA pyrophosphatase [Desulfobulbus oligotrophicus]MDY0391351.1 CoA pyrophosphatase [Desulfobulbus oligotrophicus]QQG65597.1 CoA pyrophosphatase [Desulfobulbus oligotrophicus]